MDLKESFFQIQKILDIISKEETLSKKFASLDSLREKFDFTKEKCQALSMPCAYNIEEFEKFFILADLVREVNEDSHFSNDFKKAGGVNELYDILMQKADDMGLSVRIDQSDFEDFIGAFSGGTEKVPPEDLDAVSGGTFLDAYCRRQQEYAVGVDLGRRILDLIKIIKED